MKKMMLIIVSLFLLLNATGCGSENENLEGKKFEIRFLSEGIELEKYYVKYGELISPPENPTKENYTFSHWATHEKSTDGSEKFDFNEPVTTHTTLFAHFTLNANNEDLDTTYGYEKIYNEYSEKLKKQCPTLSMLECAELSNEGISKMADYMYRASGIDGQYTTYETWAKKLTEIYLQEAR